jgi:hypothetical protein
MKKHPVFSARRKEKVVLSPELDPTFEIILERAFVWRDRMSR